MKYKLVIEAQADDDILRNARWWAKNHPLDQALNWDSTVHEQMLTLTDFPEKHPLAPEVETLSFDVHEKPVGLGSQKSFRARNRIVDDTVYVLSVQRGAQDRIQSGDLS